MTRLGFAAIVTSAAITCFVGVDSFKSRRDKSIEQKTRSLYTIYRCGYKTTSRMTQFIERQYPNSATRLVLGSPGWFDRRVPIEIRILDSKKTIAQFQFIAEPESKSLVPIGSLSQKFLSKCRRWAKSL